MDKKVITKEYSTDELTILWKPSLCIHAGICVQKLPKVYNPKLKPWISEQNASTEELVEQIDACPSGALSYKLKKEIRIGNNKSKEMEKKIADSKPIMVDLKSGKSHAWCACGHSSKQPWCDGSHKGTGISPIIFKPEESKKAAMCMCKHTNNAPHCDGSHAKLG